jgi:hypothetical protein
MLCADWAGEPCCVCTNSCSSGCHDDHGRRTSAGCYHDRTVRNRAEQWLHRTEQWFNCTERRIGRAGIGAR